MRVAVIHKPYFFPWMGYFSKLSHAHAFIVQDDVLASNRVWVNRTRIIRPTGKPGYVTLPIGKKGDTPICDIVLPATVREESARRISKSIEHAYAKSRFFSQWRPLQALFADIMAGHRRLLDIDMGIITVLLEHLQLPPLEIFLSSRLTHCGDWIDTLIANCRETRCDALILGTGNEDWTTEDTERLRRAQIQPLTHDFYAVHPAYYQTRRERLGFFPGLSILDCILNEGYERTTELLKSVPLVCG